MNRALRRAFGVAALLTAPAPLPAQVSSGFPEPPRGFVQPPTLLPDAVARPSSMDSERGMYDPHVRQAADGDGGDAGRPPRDPSPAADDRPKPDFIVNLGQEFLLRPSKVAPVFATGKENFWIDQPDSIRRIPTDLARDRAFRFHPKRLGYVRITFFTPPGGGAAPKGKGGDAGGAAPKGKGDDDGGGGGAGGGGETSERFVILIVPDAKYLNDRVKEKFPTANLVVTAVADGLLSVDGTVDNPGDVANVERMLRSYFRGVINNVRVSGVMQVQLEVVIARVDRTELRRLGVNALYSDPHGFIGSQVGNLIGLPPIRLPAAQTATSGASTFNPISAGTSALTSDSTLFFGVTDNRSGLFGFIEALRQNNMAKILANPTLVTLNGRAAEFLVGGQQPIPLSGALGVPTVDFKPFGTRLSFVPIILGEGKIRLDVVPEVSTIDTATSVTSGTVQVPRFFTQRLHTVVELRSGQTLCLGGLLQTTQEASVSKVPFLGDIPWVGALFRRTTYTTTESELLILVTPRLFDPLRACQAPAAVPGSETRTPNDHELFGLGALEAAGRVPPPPRYTLLPRVQLGDKIAETTLPRPVSSADGYLTPVPLFGAPPKKEAEDEKDKDEPKDPAILPQPDPVTKARGYRR